MQYHKNKEGEIVKVYLSETQRKSHPYMPPFGLYDKQRSQLNARDRFRKNQIEGFTNYEVGKFSNERENAYLLSRSKNVHENPEGRKAALFLKSPVSDYNKESLVPEWKKQIDPVPGGLTSRKDLALPKGASVKHPLHNTSSQSQNLGGIVGILVGVAVLAGIVVVVSRLVSN
jgi:hypothetical protein